MLFICVKIILVHLNRTKMHDDPSCIHLEKNYLRLFLEIIHFSFKSFYRTAND